MKKHTRILSLVLAAAMLSAGFPQTLAHAATGNTELVSVYSTEESSETPEVESTEAPAEDSTKTPTEESTTAPTKESTTAPTKEPATAPTKEPATAPAETPAVTAPKQPVLNKAQKTSENTASISWNAVKADGYRVYRKVRGGSWERIKEVDSSVTKITDKLPSTGAVYYYTVRAFNLNKETYLLSSYDKTGLSIVVNPKQPVLKSAVSSSYTSMTVKWNASSGADGYYVYRKVSGGSWKRIAQTNASTLSVKSTGLTCNTTYYYTVRAFIKHNDTIYLSSYDKAGVSGKPVPASPNLKSVSCEASSITVNFGSVGGATSYRVYRKTSSTGWKLLKEVGKSTFSYTDSTASKGTKYIYTVKAMRNGVAGTYNKTGIQGALKVPTVTLKKVSVSSSGTGYVQWAKQSTAEGYFVYRKEAGGEWKRIKDVSAGTSSFKETGLNTSKNYTYTVAGYIVLNGTKVKGSHDSSGIAPTLPYNKKYVRNITKTYLGTSGAGRKMYSYQIGSGSNHIVMTMAVHSWEDNWSKDGVMLITTGEKLIEYAAARTSQLAKEDYSIIIIPMANPDGLYDGTTCNGPGRCTTYRYNSSGKLVKGGIDLNRCFPAGFSAKTSARNYTGSKPLMAKEAVIIKNYIDASKGSGTNYYIDSHGWYNQIITKYGSTASPLYKAFHTYFTSSRSASFGKGCGYVAGYAQSVGYQAILFEFPAVYSKAQFESKDCANKFIKSVFYLVTH